MDKVFVQLLFIHRDMIKERECRRTGPDTNEAIASSVVVNNGTYPTTKLEEDLINSKLFSFI